MSIGPLAKYNLVRFGSVVELRSTDGTEKITFTDSNKNGIFDKNDSVWHSRKGKNLCPEYDRAKTILNANPLVVKSREQLSRLNSLVRKAEKEGLPSRCMVNKKFNSKEVVALLKRMKPDERKYVGKLFSLSKIPNPHLSKYTVKMTMFSPDFKGTTVVLERNEGLYSVHMQIQDMNYNGVLDINDEVGYRRTYHNRIDRGYLSKEDKRKFILAMSKKDKKVVDSRFMRTVKRGRWMRNSLPAPRIRTGRFGIKLKAGPEYVSSWSKGNGTGLVQRNGVGANMGIGLSVVLPHHIFHIFSALDLEAGTSIGAMIKRNDNGGTSSRTEFKPYVGLNLNVALKDWLYKASVGLFINGGYQSSILKNDQGNYDTQHGFYAGIGVQFGFMDIIRYFNPQLGVKYSNFPSQNGLKTRHDLSIALTFSH